MRSAVVDFLHISINLWWWWRVSHVSEVNEVCWAHLCFK